MKKLPVLTTTQRLGLQAAYMQFQASQAQLRAVILELGLDPAKQYTLDADGQVSEGIPETNHAGESAAVPGG